MPGRGRKHENDPGKYTADIWGTEFTQKQPSRRKPKGKYGTISIGGNSFTQDALFQGEEIRIPFPNAPVNKIPDRLGMTRDPGTLFTLPDTTPHSTQNELFATTQEIGDTTSKPQAAQQKQETVSNDERNPLLAILQEDEIYVDPFEVTIEEAEENGFPLLRRDVMTYKWWLEFSFDTREQPELYEALKAQKWKWGGYRKQWFNPSHFPELPRGMYYANAGGAFYSEENAERIEARATKAREKSNAHYERSNKLADVIPFGQPMMPDHYSYRSDLSYRKKIWKQMDLFVAFYKKAEWLDNRAEGSRRLQRRTTSISMMQNRIDRLQADLRSVRRNFNDAKREGETDLDYYRYRMTILASEIVPLQEALRERGGLPIDKIEEDRPLQPGDLIQIRGRAMYVVKVNPKTIKVADPKVHNALGKMWELTYKKLDFQKVLATKEELEARKNQQGKEE
jgi:hypothetical protein